MAFSRKRISDSDEIEKRILTAMIVSDQFCKSVRQSIKKKYFKIDYIKDLVGWILDYFDKYGKSPGRSIRDIFVVEQERLKEAEAKLIEYFLEDISDEYEGTESLNVNYLVGNAKDYFDKRSHEILFRDGANLVAAGRVEEAKKLLDKHKVIVRETGSVFDPFSPEEIKNFDIDEKVNTLFSMPGALGRLMGYMQRSWLLAVTAPEKRGKSWILEEIAFQGIIAGLKVFIISLEMNKPVSKKRIYKRLTGTVTKRDLEELPEVIQYPIFDCLNNQEDVCTRKQRTCDRGIFKELGSLTDKEGYIKVYQEKDIKKYKPCTWCRDNWSKINKKEDEYKYEAAYWFRDQKSVKLMTQELVKKKSKIFYSEKRGSNLRMRTFPAFSANSDNIKAELDTLEYTENFIPDIIIIDYFDIQKPEKGSSFSDRSVIDAIWKMGKNIADVKQCLVVTADQSNKASRSKQSVESSDTTEDKRKDAHLDVRIALNQTAREKDDMVMRVNVLFHRHRRFNVNREVMILQQLDLAQPLLDSEFI
uniref:Helicase n=1 Tax=viral metagenome TaxID=1070528 RepID=A0A6M3JJP3_9ZZZZ